MSLFVDKIVSWIVHAISNLFSGLCAAFLLI